MRTIRNLIITLTLIASLSFALVGCGLNNERMLVDENRLTVGVFAAIPPFIYLDAGGNVVGIEAEIAAEFASDLGVEVYFRNFTDFGAMLLAAQNGTIDVAMSTITVRLARLRQMNFTNPYFNAGMQVGAPIGCTVINESMTREQIIAALNVPGTRIGVHTNTTAQFFVEDYLPNATMVPFTNDVTTLEGMRSGNIDFMIADNVNLDRLNRVATTQGVMQQIDVRLSYDQFGYALRKGNYELLFALNTTLARISQDGTLRNIFESRDLLGGIYVA